MMAAEAGAGVPVAEALAAGWLEERWCVDVGQLVKMVEVC